MLKDTVAFFKKKRGRPGPSKNEQKVRRSAEVERQERASGTLASRYPGLKQLTIEADFFSPLGTPLEHRSTKIKPQDIFNVALACPGQCGRAHFLLDAAVEEMTASGKQSTQGVLICEEPLYTGPGAICSCKVQYTVSA